MATCCGATAMSQRGLARDATRPYRGRIAHRVLTPLVVCGALAAAIPVSQAAAHPIRDCGNAGTLYGGAVKVYKITSRAVRCPAARRFSRTYIRYGGSACAEDRYCRYRDWRCKNVSSGGEMDSRCTKGAHRVIRFQYRPGAIAFRPQPRSEPLYGVRGPESSQGQVHLVRAAGGARIYTETYLPAENGGHVPPPRLSTVLVMTPYETVAADAARPFNSALRHDVEHFVRRGYAVTIGHVRGTGRSEGCLDVYGRREVDATARVIEYVGRDAAWSNGRVGMYGLSYPGETQIGAAVFGDPKRTRYLQAIVPASAATSFYDSYAAIDGVPIPAADTGSFAFYAAVTNPGADEVPRPARAACLVDQLAGSGQRSGDFTDFDAEREYRRGAAHLRVPMLLARGLTDTSVHPIGDVGFLDRIPPATPHKAIVGQWGHVFPDESATGARVDWLDMVTAWYDRWLKRLPIPVSRWPDVQVQDTAGRWRAEPTWPTTGGPVGHLALSADRSGEGALGATGTPTGATTYLEQSSTLAGTGAVFTTRPLDGPLHITGQPELQLVVTLTQPDAHVGVKLEALAPDGKPLYPRQITGMRSLQHLDPLVENRFEQSTAKPAPVNRPITAFVRLVPIDLVVPPGGRLRLHIAGSTEWSIGGAPEVGAPSSSTGLVIIHHDCDHPSLLRFLMPRPNSTLLNFPGTAQPRPTAAPSIGGDGGGIATNDVCGEGPERTATIGPKRSYPALRSDGNRR